MFFFLPLCECSFIAMLMLLLQFRQTSSKMHSFLRFSVIPYGRRLKPTLSSLHEFTILFLDYLNVVLHSCCSTFHYSYFMFAFYFFQTVARDKNLLLLSFLFFCEFCFKFTLPALIYGFREHFKILRTLTSEHKIV